MEISNDLDLDCTIIPADNEEELFDLLLDGNVDAVAAERLAVLNLLLPILKRINLIRIPLFQNIRHSGYPAVMLERYFYLRYSAF